MNIGFPETQHLIPALSEISGTGSISLGVCLLDSKGHIGINSGVSVPEISVPLNDQFSVLDQDIYHELTVNDLLLVKYYVHLQKDLTPGFFELVFIGSMRKAQYAVNACLIGAVVSTLMRAIEMFCSEARTLPILLLSAGCAFYYATIAALFQFLFFVKAASSIALLPGICTVQRTKARSVVVSNLTKEHLTALLTNVSTALIAITGEVGTRGELFTAFGANRTIGVVFHGGYYTLPCSEIQA